MQDLVRSDKSDDWQKGTLGELHIVTSESQTVGLRTWFDDDKLGKMLYYGTRDNLVQELSYNSVNKSWQSGFSFALSNGNSGIVVVSSNSTSVLTMICLNSAFQLQSWSKNFDESSVASSAHQVGQWTRGM